MTPVYGLLAQSTYSTRPRGQLVPGLRDSRDTVPAPPVPALTGRSWARCEAVLGAGWQSSDPPPGTSRCPARSHKQQRWSLWHRVESSPAQAPRWLPVRVHCPLPVTSLCTSTAPSSLIRCSSSSRISSSEGSMYLGRGGCGTRLCWGRHTRESVTASAMAKSPSPSRPNSAHGKQPWCFSGTQRSCFHLTLPTVPSKAWEKRNWDTELWLISGNVFGIITLSIPTLMLQTSQRAPCKQALEMEKIPWTPPSSSPSRAGKGVCSANPAGSKYSKGRKSNAKLAARGSTKSDGVGTEIIIHQLPRLKPWQLPLAWPQQA